MQRCGENQLFNLSETIPDLLTQDTKGALRTLRNLCVLCDTKNIFREKNKIPCMDHYATRKCRFPFAPSGASLLQGH
jgi:hypothetical protein